MPKISLLILVLIPQLLFGLDLCSFLLSHSGVLKPIPAEAELDRVFLQTVEEQLERLTPRQLFYFKYAVFNLKRFHQPNYFFSKLPKQLPMAYVKPTLFLGPQLNLRIKTLNHPVSRIILIHELVHLERLVSTNFYGESLLKYFYTSASLKIERYEEEVALQAEYHLLRKAYGEKDLSRLKEDYPIYVSAETVEDLQKAGFLIGMTFISDIEIERKLQRSPEYRPLVENAINTFLNTFFLERIEKALELSEKDYTDFLLNKYPK